MDTITWWERVGGAVAGEYSGEFSDHVSRSAVDVWGFLTGVRFSISTDKFWKRNEIKVILLLVASVAYYWRKCANLTKGRLRKWRCYPSPRSQSSAIWGYYRQLRFLLFQIFRKIKLNIYKVNNSNLVVFSSNIVTTFQVAFKFWNYTQII